MMPTASFRESLIAWAKTTAISWGTMAILCSAFLMVISKAWLAREIAFVLAIASGFHLASMILIGLPFFACFWPKANSRVWDIKLSLPLGAAFGFFGMWMTFSLVSGAPIHLFEPGNGKALLLGAVYGFVTAFVAWSMKRMTGPKGSEASRSTPSRSTDGE